MTEINSSITEQQSKSTSSLTAFISPNGLIVLCIYINIKKTSGWTKRELRRSCLGVKPEDFTFDYIADEVGHVYSLFLTEEINELLTKINYD